MTTIQKEPVKNYFSDELERFQRKELESKRRACESKNQMCDRCIFEGCKLHIKSEVK